MASSLDLLKERMYDLDALHAANAMMDWDQQCLMPPGGGTARAEHTSRLSRMAHEIFTDDATGTLIERAKGEANSEDDIALVRRVKRDYDLATKLPSDFLAKRSHLASLAHEKWVEARAANDFKGFAPILEQMFDMAREEANMRGWKDHIYDALLDTYEEGATAADARAMYDGLKAPIGSLLGKIKQAQQPDDSVLHGTWSEELQKQLTLDMVSQIGFDLKRGRQDTAPHPFCTGWSIGDVRITTRFKPYLGSAIFGSLHEAGHGMYEQGTPEAWDRSPLGGGVSLGIHESQSRLWENIVGRSFEFWSYFYGKTQRTFPALSNIPLEDFYRAINKVEPSLIRVEADEVTYNFHTMIRFELECDLLEGKLLIKDLPAAWNAKYKQYLGVEPQNDSEGCLQDVHWSGGMIGYFPTYSIGNILSYQFWNRLQSELPGAKAKMAEGNFSEIHDWLDSKIYKMGRKLSPKDLIRSVTGKAMDQTDYVNGLTAKYSAIYQLS